MFQVCVMAIAGIFASVIVKKDKPEYSILIIMLVGFYIAIRVMTLLGNIVEELSQWQSLIGDNMAYITILMKLIGITYICEFASNLCKDSGNAALGSHIELFGKVAVMVAGFPVVKIMVDMIEELLG